MEFRFPEDERFPAWKITFFQCIVAAVFFGLLAGYWRLQIGQHNRYLKRAEHNRVRELPIIAPRGRILDREGRVLADSLPAFSVLLERENASTLTAARLDEIAGGLKLDPKDVRELIDESRSLPRFQPVILKPTATLDDVSFIESHQTEFPELALIQVERRVYPLHTVAAAVLGHVGEVSELSIARSADRYRPGDVVGKSGIERAYNDILEGKDGIRRVVVNSRGEEVGLLDQVNPVPGQDLKLTIDLDLQTAAENSLGDREGAVVALDPRTGKVLAMVSHPSFDPNDFAGHLDPKIWEKLTADPAKPLMNKAIQAQLAPGSVFKIIMATAALESKTITPQFTVDDVGQTTIYGHVFHSWTFWTHHGPLGYVDLHRAIVFSSDAYFYTVGKMLGIDKIDYYARQLGLGHRTGIDLPGEEPGLIPSPAWVERVFKHQWWPGETISVAIGQGAVTVTPLQLAYALGGIASGGVFHRPQLVCSSQLNSLDLDPPKRESRDFPLQDETASVVTKGMWGVVNEGGTGAGARCPGIDIGGKTGTAQVTSEGVAKSNRGKFKDNAWFVGLSPSRNPQLAVAVLVVSGEESSVAAPIAGQVIKAYYAAQPGGLPQAAKPQIQAQLMNQVSRAAGSAGRTQSEP